MGCRRCVSTCVDFSSQFIDMPIRNKPEGGHKTVPRKRIARRGLKNPYHKESSARYHTNASQRIPEGTCNNADPFKTDWPDRKPRLNVFTQRGLSHIITRRLRALADWRNRWLLANRLAVTLAVEWTWL